MNKNVHEWYTINGGEGYPLPRTGEIIYRDRCKLCKTLSWRWQSGKRQIDNDLKKTGKQ